MARFTYALAFARIADHNRNHTYVAQSYVELLGFRDGHIGVVFAAHYLLARSFRQAQSRAEPQWSRPARAIRQARRPRSL